MNDVIILYQQLKLLSEFAGLPWNNRLIEPFHLLSCDSNPHDVPYIDKNVFENYVKKSDCLICTGDKPPRERACFTTDKTKCRFNFRWHPPKNNRKNFLTQGFVETAYSSKNPLDLFIGRDQLSFNYANGYKIIARSSLFLGIELHHLNLDHMDDRLGSHCIADKEPHNDAHSFLRTAITRIKRDIEFIESCYNPEKIRSFSNDQFSSVTGELYNSLLMLRNYMNVEPSKKFEEIVKYFSEQIKNNISGI